MILHDFGMIWSKILMINEISRGGGLTEMKGKFHLLEKRQKLSATIGSVQRPKSATIGSVDRPKGASYQCLHVFLIIFCNCENLEIGNPYNTFESFYI